VSNQVPVPAPVLICKGSIVTGTGTIVANPDFSNMDLCIFFSFYGNFSPISLGTGTGGGNSRHSLIQIKAPLKGGSGSSSSSKSLPVQV